MPFQGQPVQPKRLHERMSDQRVSPYTVDLAEQHEPDSSSGRQHRRLNHQAQIRDLEISGRPLQRLQQGDTRHIFRMPPTPTTRSLNRTESYSHAAMIADQRRGVAASG
jgi:hypothetical protein